LLLTHHPAGDPSFADIDQIRQNATRAAGLVRQLLAFSRQQTLMPTVIWLPDIVADNRMLLKRLLGEKVELEIKHERDLGLVRVDETQLIQVLMNLAVNARDAMPEGGQLTIRTANVSQAEAVALGHEIMRPDDYVLIEVSDTGCGIPKELLGKIFEPFFTTKAVGQGTGLGLSTVYGIVKQTNGFVFPDSEVGKGTTFRIYLPRHFEEPKIQDSDAVREVAAQDHTGRGTILLVEDEDAVRSFAARALSTRGYSVLEAANGEVALDLMRGHDGSIDMVISDVIMPGIDGPTLVKTVRAERPTMRIILISGYAEDAFRKELSRDGHDLAFLPKPFSLKQLISKVKEVMSG
jgi:two-component system cell cycle sensor histidine kinase/response regulator CckA